ADARVAVDVDDELAGVRDLRADCGGQTEAHRAHAARREPETRLAEVAVLRGPHLVLTDAARDDGLAVRDAIHRLDDVLRLHERTRTVVVQSVRRLQRRDLA